VRLKDVAERAGVSRTTASFVMAGRQDMRISETSRRRVVRAAEELNYRPNLMARGLRTKVTNTVAFLSDTVATDPYAGQLVYGSLAAALEQKRLLFIGETEGDPKLEARLIQSFLDRQVDGFIYAAMYTRVVSIPQILRGHPVVLLNCASRSKAASAVVPDEINAGRTAARTLLEAGHTTGIYIVGEHAPHVFAGRERLEGIEDTMRAARIPLAGTVSCPWWPEPAFEAVARLLRSRRRRPTAFICLNDRIALGAYQALQEAGLRIPDNVSVVSFDDSDLASWLRPQLTSIAIPHVELGRRAVERLLAEQPTAGIERVSMPLRARSSVAAIPTARRQG
jgi:LacI family transcriptional regulator